MSSQWTNKYPQNYQLSLGTGVKTVSDGYFTFSFILQ